MPRREKKGSREEVLAQIAMGIAPASGAEFFPLLVHHLARALDMNCALVGELGSAGETNLSSLTINLHGKLAGNFEYSLQGSPFEGIRDRGFVCFHREAHSLFPKDQFLAEMRFESCAAVPLHDSEGAIVGIMAFMDERELEDCALAREVLDFLAPRVGAEIERKRHEEALRFTQFSIDRSSDASFWMGPDGRFTYVNDAACQSLGYRREELLSMSVQDIDPIHSADKWPETWERVRSESAFTFESVHVRKDGSSFPVEITVNYLEFGGREYNCAFARDISGRKQNEEALRRSSERFRQLIERMPEGMIVHRFGPILYANPKAASAVGYNDPEELIGLSVVDLVTPELREASRERVQRMRDTGSGEPAREMYIQRKDGGTTITEMEAIPIDFDGEPAVLTIVRDITERKRMQARLLQADRMASVGTLAAGVAHEINNPLAYVITNLDYLVKELPGMVKSLSTDAAQDDSLPRGGNNGGVPAQIAERLDDIEETLQEAREGAERVRLIVRDLRTFSRDGDEERGPVDAERVLESSINMAWSEIRKHAELVKDYKPMPPVHATKSRLGQVFLNLLLNAAQAFPGDRAGKNKICVSTAPLGDDRVMIEVRDTGVGIPPENLDRIFQPFFTTKPIGIGTGLGLSICQNIIASLDGELSVRSEEGRYTCFRILLPVSPANGISGRKTD